MIRVKWSEFLDAYEFASAFTLGECTAFLCLDTGAFYFVGEDLELEEEAPEDVESSDRYLALPGSHDLDLGKRLALSFVEQRLPRQIDTVDGYFRKRGAYGRFKDLLDRHGALEAWYTFESQAVERELRGWCEARDIELV